ncbi:hypothetical protein BH09ACT6_BH09ACT6_11040 [soil metagenome]
MREDGQDLPFSSALVGQLSLLVNRWSSHHFQLAHASRLHNERDFTANKLLYLLGSNGPMRPSELAVELGSGRANVSKVVSRLLADGLVCRSVDPRDSRAQLVQLTERGGVVSADVFRIGEDMVRELTAEWSDADRRRLTELLRRLNQNTDAYERRLSASQPKSGLRD